VGGARLPTCPHKHHMDSTIFAKQHTDTQSASTFMAAGMISDTYALAGAGQSSALPAFPQITNKQVVGGRSGLLVCCVTPLPRLGCFCFRRVALRPRPPANRVHFAKWRLYGHRARWYEIGAFGVWVLVFKGFGGRFPLTPPWGKSQCEGGGAFGMRVNRCFAPIKLGSKCAVVRNPMGDSPSLRTGGGPSAGAGGVADFLGLGRTRPGAARSRKTPDPPPRRCGAAKTRPGTERSFSDPVAPKPKGGTWVRPPLIAAALPRSGARQDTPPFIPVTRIAQL
jgi:hypothetical protein